MLFFVLNVKMNRTIQDEENPKPTTTWLSNVVQIVTTERTRRPALTDLLVAVIAIPLLMACAILLYSYMRMDWIRDGHMRFRVLALGLALLFISLLVCIYATKRLGLCKWPTPEQHACRRRTISARSCLPPRESQMQLFVATELPPSYDSVISSDIPPPYNSITFHISNETGEVTRSTLTPVHSGMG